MSGCDFNGWGLESSGDFCLPSLATFIPKCFIFLDAAANGVVVLVSLRQSVTRVRRHRRFLGADVGLCHVTEFLGQRARVSGRVAVLPEG